MSWRETSLGEVLSVRHGKSQRAVESPSGRYPVLATGGRIGWSQIPLYSKPSVLIGRKGTIDRPQYQDSPFWTVDTLFYTELTKSVDPRFIYYIFQTIDWRSMNEASGVPSLSSSRIENIGVKLPSLDEQIIIREALDDADELIKTLERLIAKKQAIKTGMMQRLLTARTRLPSFTESWTHSTLGELGATVRGVGYNPDEDLSRHRGAQTVDLLRANNVQGAELDLCDVQYVNQLRVRTDQFLRKDDVLICAANGSKRLVGKAARVESEPLERSTFGAFMMVFRPDPSRILPAYSALHFQTKSYRDLLSVLLAGSSINNLRPSDIASFEIPIPDRDEQIAIVASVDDLTAQIRILQTRLGKTQAVKRGMMQQLLTGRTRLPLEAAA